MDFTQVLKIVGSVAGIGGLALGVFLILFREFIRKNIFSKISHEHSYQLLKLFMVLVWSIAVLGLFSWIYVSQVSNTSQSKSLPLVIKGLVLNHRHQPIANAVVKIDRLPGDSVLTTSSGAFKLKKVSGKVGDEARVYVYASGYQLRDEYVTLPGPIRIVLEEQK